MLRVKVRKRKGLALFTHRVGRNEESKVKLIEQQSLDLKIDPKMKAVNCSAW